MQWPNAGGANKNFLSNIFVPRLREDTNDFLPRLWARAALVG